MRLAAIRLRALGCGSLIVALTWIVGSSGESPVGAQQEEPFPHLDHQGLFPLCTGCHEGIPVGDRTDWYPEPSQCSGCHDGVERDRVTWNGPSERIDNVAFDHVEHADEREVAGDPEGVCADCHIPSGGGRMEVATTQIQVETCWSCHAHATDDHYADDASCETCHLPLASTRFSTARIETLPRPAGHEPPDAFLLEAHGDLAEGGTTTCATCHTRERCLSCHVDPEVAEIASVPSAPPTMALPAMEARYPEPESHLDAAWLQAHRSGAEDGTCGTCHAAEDCRSCHVEAVPGVVAAMPSRYDVHAPGVMLEERSPDSHGSLFFMQAHAVLASADQASCQTCHVERFCVECHEGPVGGGYHPPNFMMRHSADAYGRDAECSNCHEQRVFCRACHTDLGLGGLRQAAAGYHDATAIWLLQHGQAARQNLESCASCHRQVDCTRCHSTLGAFQVSPHSPSFDAERAWRQSPRTCFACHTGNPSNGSSP